MYFVAAGTLSVTVADETNGGSVTVGHLHPGDFFGEAALLSDNGRRTATVVADDFCELFVLNRHVLRVANRENDNLRHIIAQSIERRRKQTACRKIFHRVRRKIFCCTVFIWRLRELRHAASRHGQHGSGVGRSLLLLKSGSRRASLADGLLGALSAFPSPGAARVATVSRQASTATSATSSSEDDCGDGDVQDPGHAAD